MGKLESGIYLCNDELFSGEEKLEELAFHELSTVAESGHGVVLYYPTYSPIELEKKAVELNGKFRHNAVVPLFK